MCGRQMGTVEEKAGKIKQKAQRPLHFLCRVNSGVKTEAKPHAPAESSKSQAWEDGKPNNILQEAASLSFPLSSWTERHKEAGGAPEKEEGGNASLGPHGTTSTQAATESARVLGDELISNWKPRCLQTSVFSKAVVARFTSSSHRVKHSEGHLCPAQEGAEVTNPNIYLALLLVRITSILKATVIFP